MFQTHIWNSSKNNRPEHVLKLATTLGFKMLTIQITNGQIASHILVQEIQ